MGFYDVIYYSTTLQIKLAKIHLVVQNYVNFIAHKKISM